MVLVITPSNNVRESVPTMVEATAEAIHIAPSLRQAAILLRSNEYAVVMLDQLLVDSEPAESELLMQNIGTAIPLYLNFGISGTRRVVQELRAALQRRNVEFVAAKNAAEQALRTELSGSVTAMLLSCEMALKVPELPTAAETKLRTICELAQELKGRFNSDN